MSTEERQTAISWLWRIMVVALIYFVAILISGAVVTVTGLEWPTIAEPASQTTNILLNLVSSFLIAACLALLAGGIRGSQFVRWLILAAFTYVTLGLNNQIEAAIFTTFGGTAAMLVFFVLPCLFGAAAAVWLFHPPQVEAPFETTIANYPTSAWWWRIPAAWLAFPIIYLFFGMLAAPLVVPVYQEQNFGLTLPGMGTILPVVLGRSALYLAVTIPILVNWSRSRRSLILSLGIAFFAMMGLIGLLTATFFPPILRIVHSIEILGDGLVYAWLLVALFIPKTRVENTEPVPAVAE